MFAHRKGFTLIELLIVLSILLVVSMISGATFFTINKSQALSADTELVLSVLTKARNDTLSSKDATQYGVHFAGDEVTIFAGSAYYAGASTNRVSTLSSYTTVTKSIAGGGNDILFSRLTGKTAHTGTLTLSVAGVSPSKVITVYATGIAQVQ